MTFMQKLKRDKIALVSLSIIGVVILLGIFAPLVAPHSPVEIDIKNKFASASLAYPFGADKLGRCIFSRILYGIRTTLFLSLLTMAATVFIGSVLGFIAGFFRGWVDEIIMRVCDVVLSFPSEVMILAIVGIMGPGLLNVVLANIIAKWAWYTRMIRSIVIQYTDKNYIRFAKISGCSTFYILRKHLLQNAMGEITVLGTLDTGWVILSISSLSFLGLGVQPPMAEWGMMLNEAKDILAIHPAQMLPAGLTILIVVAAFNFLGDSLRDAFDPKYSGRREGV